MKRKQQRTTHDRRRGAAMVEYIIIVVIVAIAAIAIFGVFGDTIRQKLGGAVTELGGSTSERDEALGTSSEDWLKNLGPEGQGTGGGSGATP